MSPDPLHESATPHVLLSGATGFVGSQLHRAFNAAGYPVRSLIRPDSRPRAGPLACFDPVYGNIDDPSVVARGLEHARAVVYAAGMVRGRSLEEFTQANVTGVEVLVAALQQMADPPPLLLISSLVASEPSLSWYATSKAAGEQVLRRSTLANWTILRPPALYGRGDVEMRPLLSLIRKGFVLMPGGSRQRISLLHVDDLACAVLAWLVAPGTCAGKCFSIGNGGTADEQSSYTWQEIGHQVRDGSCRYMPLSRTLLDTVAHINLRLARLFDYAPMLTPGKVRELRYPAWLCDNCEFTRLTGWHPRIGLREGTQALFTGQSREEEY